MEDCELQNNGLNKKSGFTLLETLLVIGIISLLMTLVVQVARKAKLKAMLEATRAQIVKYDRTLHIFFDKHHEYPLDRSEQKACNGSECLFEFLCKSYEYKSECDVDRPTECLTKVDEPLIVASSLQAWEFEGKKKPSGDQLSRPNKIFDIFGTELRFISPGKARPDKNRPSEEPDIFSCGINKKCESEDGQCSGDDICNWNEKSMRK